MTDNLEQLREVADKIKGLAWELDGFSDGDDYVRLELYGDEARSQVIASSINNIDHAHYLNAARPSTVLALIDRIEAAEAAVQRVRDLAETWISRVQGPVRWVQLLEMHYELTRALDGGEQE